MNCLLCIQNIYIATIESLLIHMCQGGWLLHYYIHFIYSHISGISDSTTYRQ